jgi:hypothetical protein
MATDTFYKRIVLSNEAAEILAAGFDEPRPPYVPKKDMAEELRKGDNLLRQLISQSRKSSKQMAN